MILLFISQSKNILITFVFCLGVLFFTPIASAQVIVTDGDLTVDFESLPLFGVPDETNIAPSHIATKSVVVTNTGTELESVIVNVTNEFSTGLAEGIILSITDSNIGDVYFSDTMSNLFLDVPVSLGILEANASRSYDLKTEFLNAGGNTYQTTTMGFDIHFGFESGASVTPGGSGGGSGTGNQPTPGIPNPTPPQGLVAGATSDAVPSWWQPVIAGVQSLFGESTESGDTISTEENPLEVEVAGINADISPFGEPTATLLGVDGTLLWLLLLAVLSVVASLVDDLWEHRRKEFLKLLMVQLIFTVVYVLAVLSAHFLGWLDSVWYFLAGTWVVMQVIDYRVHAKLWELWQPQARLLTLAGLGLILILLSLFIGWPGVW